MGDFVHQAFQGKLGLGSAITAKGAGGWVIGVDDFGVKAHIRAAIGSQAAQPGYTTHRQAMDAIGPGIFDNMHVQGVQRAVFHHAGAIHNLLRVA